MGGVVAASQFEGQGMDVGGIQCGSVMAHLDCPFDWNMEHLRD